MTFHLFYLLCFSFQGFLFLVSFLVCFAVCHAAKGHELPGHKGWEPAAPVRATPQRWKTLNINSEHARCIIKVGIHKFSLRIWKLGNTLPLEDTLIYKFDKMFFPWISDTGFYDERTRAVKRCKIPKGYPLLEICTILDRGYVEIQSLEAWFDKRWLNGDKWRHEVSMKLLPHIYIDIHTYIYIYT